MLGIKHKLTDRALYIFHDIVENNLLKVQQQLKECNDNQVEEITQLKNQIAFIEQELLDFDNEIANQRAVSFQFSIEEIYYMYGQYENKFIDIEFHKKSDAALNYGRNIGGVLIYHKTEREDFEKIISSSDFPRTNGLVKLNISPLYNLSDKQSIEIQNTGFLSGDVFQINSVNIPSSKTFKKDGLKEIPNTVNIEFDPIGINLYKMELRLLSNRLNDGGLLTDNEWCKLCGYLLLYEPKSTEIEFINKRTFDKNGVKFRNVRFYELKALSFNTSLSDNESDEFYELLCERSFERIEIVREMIKKSTNKSLSYFQKCYPEIYREIAQNLMNFEDESIEFIKTRTPIYWDFKSFIHIYLKHCEELQIEGHFKDKTKFQYTQKDIKRLLATAIGEISNKIEKQLSAGKDFRIYGDKSLYFNGNYYCLTLLTDK